jgi:S1-C subfamily serine protease
MKPFHKALVLLVWAFVAWPVSKAQDTTPPPSQPTPNTASNSFGTGFVVAPGYVLTAHHLLDGKDSLYVGPNAQRKWVKARIVKANAALDLVLLQVNLEATELPIAQWRDVPIGLEIYALGYPQPAYQGFSKKITAGIINGNRSNQEDLSQQRFFQFSAEASKGNSGGPVIGSDGSVVGMVQRKLNAMTVVEKSQDLVINVNYALKSSLILEFLQDTPAAAPGRLINPQLNLRPMQIYRQSEASVFSVIGRNSAGTLPVQ